MLLKASRKLHLIDAISVMLRQILCIDMILIQNPPAIQEHIHDHIVQWYKQLRSLYIIALRECDMHLHPVSQIHHSEISVLEMSLPPIGICDIRRHPIL